MAFEYPLGDLGCDHFLAEFWQRKPLLIRQAIPGYRCPLDGNELAGLAMEEDIESRLVFEHGLDEPWELRNGPFSEAELQALPSKDWTLLVQAVDHWVPEIEHLRQRFDFLPSWRLDDVMISLAAPGGGVGPHFDYYDVFLLQGQGRRRWQIGQVCDASTAVLPGTSLSILAEFEQTAEWVLEPGDMLYLPPGIAHWGVALEDCITVSIGFRAPTESELIGVVADRVMDTYPTHRRYTDPPLSPAPPGLIPEASIDRVQEMFERLGGDRELLADCFGRLITERKYPLPEDEQFQDEPTTDWHQAVSDSGLIRRDAAARFAWRNCSSDATLFVDGHAYSCRESQARLLCGREEITAEAIKTDLDDPQGRKLIAALLAAGALLLD